MLLLLFLPTHHATASDFTGSVIGIIDGDTIDVLHNGQAERIRLKNRCVVP
jgi:endonuclease YncB( thermonuclease family)